MRWLKETRTSRRLMLLAPILLLANGCAHDASVIDTSCRWYKPVCLSRTDTDGTIDQVLKNEAAFEAICPVEAKAAQC